jgi:hypothetical protein
MNYLEVYFKVCLTLLASTALFSAVPFHVTELSTADFVAIEAIITQGDEADQIQAILHDDCHLNQSYFSARLLRHMIERDRVKSFAFIYNRIDSSTDYLPSRFSDNDKSGLLLLAFQNHSLEIFDFLLGLDLYYHYWHGFWPLAGHWTTKELRDILARHPRKARLFTSSLYSSSAEAINMEETLDRIAINLLVSDDLRCHPTIMLGDLINSKAWGTDEEFATLFSRLVDAGAEVSEEMRSTFSEKYPNHELAMGSLFKLIHPDIKKPVEE